MEGCQVNKCCQRPSQFEGSLEGSLIFVLFIQLILRDASSVSFMSFNPFRPTILSTQFTHKKRTDENELTLSLSEFIMKCKTKIIFLEKKC